VKKFLVSGASGFLGSAVIPRLLSGDHAVIGLDPVATSDIQHRLIIDDLSDRKRLQTILKAESITHVIHCGGVSGPMVLADAPARVMEINAMGSLNLLLASLDSGCVKTFLYSSSVSAIGDFYEQEPITADYPLRPMNAYGCSKAAVDMILRGLWRRTPIDLCSLRFTGIYGPGRRTRYIVDDIVAGALRNEPVRVEPMTDWPYIYIDDAADAVVAACLSQHRHELFYFIAYPEQVTPEQLAAAAGQGHAVRLAYDNSVKRAARGPLDIKPAQTDFGFAPKVDYREGVRRMVEAGRTKQK
jgi:nucleoside-diphosphate-sugar epimerase